MSTVKMLQHMALIARTVPLRCATLLAHTHGLQPTDPALVPLLIGLVAAVHPELEELNLNASVVLPRELFVDIFRHLSSLTLRLNNRPLRCECVRNSCL